MVVWGIVTDDDCGLLVGGCGFVPDFGPPLRGLDAGLLVTLSLVVASCVVDLMGVIVGVVIMVAVDGWLDHSGGLYWYFHCMERSILPQEPCCGWEGGGGGEGERERERERRTHTCTCTKTYRCERECPLYG